MGRLLFDTYITAMGERGTEPKDLEISTTVLVLSMSSPRSCGEVFLCSKLNKIIKEYKYNANRMKENEKYLK